jgi:hypothetical protein
MSRCVLRSSRTFEFASPSIVRWLVKAELRMTMFRAPFRIEPPVIRSPSIVNPASPLSKLRPIVAFAPSAARTVIALLVPDHDP